MSEEKKLTARHRYVVAATTVWSGASYVYSKDAVKILPQSPTSGAAGGEGKAGAQKKGEDGTGGKGL